MAEHESFVQLLTPAGARRDHPEYTVEFTDAQYRDLYEDLVTVRRLDAEAVALQRQGELGLWPSLLGQEAAQIGSGRALRRQDVAFPSYREHAVAWCRGADPMGAIRLFRGVDHGAWEPTAANFYGYSIVIGTHTLHATGYAMGVTKDGNVGTDDATAVITYFGDGATSEGDTNEALVWAGVFSAPVVFFCQNNQYAISAPTHRQSRVPLHQRAAGFGIPGIAVDGNDVLATYAVTRAALDRARHGEGPTFIEAVTYRMAAHTTSDDASRYRTADEVEHWSQRDPITRYRAFLEREQLADAQFFGSVDERAARHATELRHLTLTMPDPTPANMLDNVYAEPDPEHDAQVQAYREYLNSFTDQPAVSSGAPVTCSSQIRPGGTS